MISTILRQYRKSHPRLTNHYGLALLSLGGCIVAGFIGGPDQPILDTLSLGTGYVALLLVLLTLLIGPINMLKKRKNPVNMMFRRDAGIWAGITAILHMGTSLLLYFGGNLLLYFFAQQGTDLSFSFDLFYLSNYVGVIAGLVILFLLVLSNNYFLKIFKGPKWKQFQQFNYLLFVVALLHTLGQQLTNSRSQVLTYGVLGLAVVVLVAQSIGFVVYRQRDRQRKAASSPVATTAGAGRKLPRTAVGSASTQTTTFPAVPAAIPAPTFSFQSVQAAPAATSFGVGRRRFLFVAGTVMLSGAVGALSAKVVASSTGTGNSTAGYSTSEVASSTSGGISPSAATSTQATGVVGSSPTTTTSAVTTTNAATATTGAASTAAATKAATTAPASTTGTATTAAAKTTVTSGTVLATIATLAAGKAIAFTTPDTKKYAFVVHRQDGTVGCFSGICTHEPVNLTFNESSQTLYCPRHGVPFDIQTGAPERGPARTALAKYSVTVDSQGQIIYG